MLSKLAKFVKKNSEKILIISIIILLLLLSFALGMVTQKYRSKKPIEISCRPNPGIAAGLLALAKFLEANSPMLRMNLPEIERPVPLLQVLSLIQSSPQFPIVQHRQEIASRIGWDMLLRNVGSGTQRWARFALNVGIGAGRLDSSLLFVKIRLL